MTRSSKLLRKLERGAVRNVAFADLRALAEAVGFRLVRKRGSHHIFARDGVAELLNLQEVGGEAKPYQIRQLLRLLKKYNLTLEDDA